MGLRVALMSGGKDSLYAAMRVWPPDLAVFLHYGWEPPSPHVANLGKSLESILSTGVDVVVYRSGRRGWAAGFASFLSRLGVSELVAGDVYVEDHLRFWEKVASEAGARLLEPLWGMDPVELVYKVFESGVRSVVVGAYHPGVREFLGRVLDSTMVDTLVERARREGWDPLGERGEYHTIVLESPVHERRLEYKVCERLEGEGWSMIRIC